MRRTGGMAYRTLIRRLGIGLVLASAGAFLAGCTSASGLADRFFGMRTPNTAENITELDESFFSTGYCPTIKIRPGTESFVQFDKAGSQTNENVRYQQTITKTARECRYVSGQLNLKIGVAGRVAAGPKGSAGTVVAPVRIAVLKGDTVAYSELHKIEVALTQPQLASDFAKVVEIPVPSGPGETDAEILVGFDDQASAKKRP